MRIRNKLTFKFVIIVATILFIFSCAIYYFSATFREQEFDKRLVNKGLTAAKLLLEVDEVDIKLLRVLDRNNLTTLANEKITVYDHQFNKMYSSDDDPEIPISSDFFRDIKTKGEVLFNNEKNEAVGILFKEKGKDYYIIVSAYDVSGISKLNYLRIILIGGFVLVMGGVFIAGWIFSGQAMKPISDIVNEVKNISATNLNSRISQGNGQDEIAMLAIQFNGMLSRLEQSFEMQKNFVSNASHELRTPLSTIRAQLDVSLASERESIEYREVLVSVQDDINKLISLTNGLLDLAQAGSETTRFMNKKIRLDELLYQCISDTFKKYPSRQINLHIDESLEDDTMLVINGNEMLLKTAFINLLDNACKYSFNKPVDVSVSFERVSIIVSVKDKGVGITSDEIHHIFDPFYRGSNVKSSSGHGIGLPLSQKIVQLHNGTIELTPNEDEGTNAIIYLPVVA